MMKKRNLFVAAFMAMGAAVSFTSCSNDEDVINGGNAGEEAAQQIVLQVASSGDGLTTRAGRPLESSEAAQQIDNVKVIITDGANNVVYVTTVSQWDSNSTQYTTGGHGRQTVIEIPKADKLDVGSYTVYAIGYSNSSDYKNIATDVEGIAKGGTFNKDLKLELKDDAKAEEIFAGSLALTVEAGKGFKTPVVLNRQVAGTFGYVKDIPAIEGATKLQLIASAENTDLVLGAFGNFDLTGNGTGNDGHINYVVNGADATAGEEHVVYEVDLNQWFNDPDLDEDGNGIVDAGGNWKGESTKYAEGSVFGGTFVIPFSKVTSENTFTLRLTNGTETLREWRVKLPGGDGQLSAHTLLAWGDEGFGTGTSNTDTETTYNVVRNHLYGIGIRTSSEPEEPGEEGTDEPESLNTKQELVLRVNDNWEVIHNMTID